MTVDFYEEQRAENVMANSPSSILSLSERHINELEAAGYEVTAAAQYTLECAERKGLLETLTATTAEIAVNGTAPEEPIYILVSGKQLGFTESYTHTALQERLREVGLEPCGFQSVISFMLQALKESENLQKFVKEHSVCSTADLLRTTDEDFDVIYVEWHGRFGLYAQRVDVMDTYYKWYPGRWFLAVCQPNSPYRQAQN